MIRTVGAFVALTLMTTGAASAQSESDKAVAQFYKGKRVDLVTSASIGGGYDQYARLLAKHMPRHIPGEPSITVKNMVGAEGLKAGNFLYNVAAQDGSVIGGLQRNNGVAKFYDPTNGNIQFDARKFHWLGSPQQEVGLFVLATKTGVKSVEDLKTHEVTVSSTARNAPTSIYPRLLNALYGSKIKVIEGYEGSQSGLIAIERGEVDGNVSGGSSAAFRARIAPMLQSGQAQVVALMGMRRDPDYPNAPTALEMMSDPASKQLFEIAFTEQVMGRPFLLPPGVPSDRVKALRAAFDATMKDKAFLDDAASQKVEIDPVSGEDINALLDRVYSAPPDLANKLRDLIR
ncbi:MAG: Bug family tripartite tricarboxylate transporter substrate binding protein [Gemmatimonas sp.]